MKAILSVFFYNTVNHWDDSYCDDLRACLAGGFEVTGTTQRDYANPPVPIPGAVYLLGSGLIGLAGLRKKLNTGVRTDFLKS